MGPEGFRRVSSILPGIAAAIGWLGATAYLVRSQPVSPLPVWVLWLLVGIPTAALGLATVVASGRSDGVQAGSAPLGIAGLLVRGSRRIWPALLVVASLPLAHELPAVLHGHLAAAQVLVAMSWVAWRVPAQSESGGHADRVAGRLWCIGLVALLASISILYLVLGHRAEGSRFWDGAYYFGVARHMALTWRLEEPIVWHFLNPPESIVHPPFDYWGGATAMLLAPLLWLFGSSHHAAIVAMSAIAALSVIAFAYLVTRAYPLRHGLAQLATVLLFAFSPFGAWFRFDTESIPLSHLFLLLALISFARERYTWTVAWGLLLVFARADGLLPCLFLWSACAIRIASRPRGDRGPALWRVASAMLACVVLYSGYHISVFGTPIPPGPRAVPYLESIRDLFVYGEEREASLRHLLARLEPRTLLSGLELGVRTLRNQDLVPAQDAWLLLAAGCLVARRPTALLAWALLLTPLLSVHGSRAVFTGRAIAPFLPVVIFAGGVALDEILDRLGAWMRRAPSRRWRRQAATVGVFGLAYAFLGGLQPYADRPSWPAPFESLDEVLKGEPVATTTPYQVIAYTRSPATSIPINGEAAIDEVLRRYRIRWLLLPSKLPRFIYAGTPSEGLLTEIRQGSRTRLGSFRLEPAGRDGSYRLFRVEPRAGRASRR